jgi:DNA mismatch endonuclease (patch repair protein)
MMVDTLPPERRSWNMSRIRGRDTGPELQVRSLLHRAGFRFRLHDKTLPGRPDIVLRKYRAAIFVHGCYWHRHPGCARSTTPGTRTDYWTAKFEGTVSRDRQAINRLEALGWKALVVWECELEREPAKTLQRLTQELRGYH